MLNIETTTIQSTEIVIWYKNNDGLYHFTQTDIYTDGQINKQSHKQYYCSSGPIVVPSTSILVCVDVHK